MDVSEIMEDLCNDLGDLNINKKIQRRNKARYETLINPFTKRPIKTTVNNCRKLTEKLHYLDILLAWRTMIKWHEMDGYNFSYSVNEISEILQGYDFMPYMSTSKGVDIWMAGSRTATYYHVQGDDEERVDAWIQEMYAEYHPGGYGTTMTKSYVDGKWYVNGYVGRLGT